MTGTHLRVQIYAVRNRNTVQKDCKGLTVFERMVPPNFQGILHGVCIDTVEICLQICMCY